MKKAKTRISVIAAVILMLLIAAAVAGIAFRCTRGPSSEGPSPPEDPVYSFELNEYEFVF